MVESIGKEVRHKRAKIERYPNSERHYFQCIGFCVQENMEVNKRRVKFTLK